jgi:hypothetical protein
MNNAEATLAMKKKLQRLLVDMGSETEIPNQEEIDTAIELVEVIWEELSLRVVGVSDVTGMINLAAPSNIFEDETA